MPLSSSTRVIHYELNEVPWRVFDKYVETHPSSALAELGRTGSCLTTVTKDAGELHPWTTWPTVHRGVYNDKHKISFINQELPTKYPPIWELLADRGVRVGIFGCLQSHGSFPEDLSSYDFYVPDTFAASPKTFPREYESFQRLNLRMTARDGAGSQPGVPMDGQVIRDLVQMGRSGLSLSTVRSLVTQVVRELRDSNHTTRRSVYQAPVAFDIFLRAYDKTTPQYASFFTNHVAGMMHRYWQHSFPEDFQSPAQKNDPVRQSNIEFAMNIADKQVRQLLALSRRVNATLLLTSSMGQEAIDRGPYFGELRITEPEKLLSFLKFTRPVRSNLAMQPDFSFALDREEDAIALEESMKQFLSADGSPIFRFKRAGSTLNCNLGKCKRACETETLLQQTRDSRIAVPLASLGISVLQRDVGTGYHQPRGIAVACGPRVSPSNSRRDVESTSILPTLLRSFGVAIPDYCAAPLDGFMPPA